MMTHSFDAFWSWIQHHPNCLVRVATPDAVLYDDDSVHWFIGADQNDLVVQQIRGKRLSGEILVDPERVTYVQEVGEERQGEFLFEAIAETPAARFTAYTFVVAHGFDEEAEPAHGTGPVH